ncbi:MAG: hypothetical protein C0593_06495 [Marinilabiliales bacterium]|nr:MAG: hypothetical protein C0593_06495 [Marinilabiliales bacterium]
MKPVRNAEPIAMWVLRIALLLYAFTYYFGTFKAFDFDSMSFWFALVILVFCGLVFIGGFGTRNNQLTLWSSLILLIMSVLQIVMEFPNGITPYLSLYILVAGVALLFLSRGNK